MKPGQKAKYETYCEKLTAMFEKLKPKSSGDSPKLNLKLIAHDDKIEAKFLMILPGYSNPLRKVVIPQGLREALKDVDQYYKLKVTLGADAEEILTSDKPILEHSLKGFCVQIDVVFLKKLKKALLSGFEGTDIGKSIKDGLMMGGPAFALNSNLSLDLTFDDMEEIKAHPMASTVLVSADQLLQGLLGVDKKAVQEWEPDFSSIDDKEEFDKFCKENEYTQEMNEKMETYQLVSDMLKDFDKDCKINLSASVFDLGSVEYKIEGAGYGDLVHLLFNAITMGARNELAEGMVQMFEQMS